VVGVGGILFDPKGKIEGSYTQGLGISTNNHAEAYAMLQGPRVVLDLHLTSQTIIKLHRYWLGFHKRYQGFTK